MATQQIENVPVGYDDDLTAALASGGMRTIREEGRLIVNGLREVTRYNAVVRFALANGLDYFYANGRAILTPGEGIGGRPVLRSSDEIPSAAGSSPAALKRA